MDKPVKLNQSEIAAIERTLAKGERVELIPVKDGVRIFEERKKEIFCFRKSTGTNYIDLGAAIDCPPFGTKAFFEYDYSKANCPRETIEYISEMNNYISCGVPVDFLPSYDKWFKLRKK